MRESNSPDAIVQHVRVVAHIRANKWKVEWIEPNQGLVDYVTSAQIIAPWKERKAFLKEEACERRLREHNKELGYQGDDAPVPAALYEVFDSIGDDLSFYKGILSGSPDALTRFSTRAKLPAIEVQSPGYVDRAGRIRLSFDFAIKLAQKFCAAEPATVLVGIDATEQEWTRKVSGGEMYLVGLLQKNARSLGIDSTMGWTRCSSRPTRGGNSASRTTGLGCAICTPKSRTRPRGCKIAPRHRKIKTQEKRTKSLH